MPDINTLYYMITEDEYNTLLATGAYTGLASDFQQHPDWAGGDYATCYFAEVGNVDQQEIEWMENDEVMFSVISFRYSNQPGIIFH